MTRTAALLTLLAALAAGIAAADSPASMLAGYAAEAGTTPSAERGRDFFLKDHTGGKPDTPSCQTCHTADPRAQGRTRAGKVIEPMAPSVNPRRFTDLAETEKWFGRNCNSVLGRACTAAEKADVIAWLNSL